MIQRAPKDKMNENTLKAITRHGESLLAAFQSATEKNPVELCKKLRRIEISLAAPLLKNCNEGMDEAELDAICDRAMLRVCKLLGVTGGQIKVCGLRINRDPRGYALKFSSEWTRAHNDKLMRGTEYARMLTIRTDMGGYGILAPDLNL